MNILLVIVLVIVAFLAFIFIAALFTRKDYAIEREIVINKPKEVVFDYIRYLRNQELYSKWVMTDPNMKKSFRGTDGSVGFVYAWDGNKKAGKGEQEIMNLVPYERMDLEIRFEKPFEGIGHSPFILEAVSENETKIRWGMSSEMKYPLNIMLLVMNVDKMLGKDIEESLQSLKKILEQ
jgi:hypothetical protein